MHSTPTVFRLLAFLLAPFIATSAMAWGGLGHRVIAAIAAGQLTPKAQAEVDRLLALEPGETLATISTWADDHRNPTTAAWHYVNFPKSACEYDAQRDCPDGQCVVGAIDRQSKVLASSASDPQRLLALKYLVHLVADVHQPLHAGYAEDRGGNGYQLQAFMRGTNLHALWDVGLISNLNMEVEALAAKLAPLAKASPSMDADALRAALESCRIVGMPGFYPARTLDAAYVERFTPIMEQRLALAGARLATLLNRLLQ